MPITFSPQLLDSLQFLLLISWNNQLFVLSFLNPNPPCLKHPSLPLNYTSWNYPSLLTLNLLPFPWDHIYCIHPSHSGVYIIPKKFTRIMFNLEPPSLPLNYTLWNYPSLLTLNLLPFPWNHIYYIHPSHPAIYIIPKKFNNNALTLLLLCFWLRFCSSM